MVHLECRVVENSVFRTFTSSTLKIETIIPVILRGSEMVLGFAVLGTGSVGSGRHGVCARRPREEVMMSGWISSSAGEKIEAPVDVVYEEYRSGVKDINSWSPWIESVDVVDPEKGISKWTVRAQGLTFNWLAQNTNVTKDEIIAWKSISGLSNRGSVKFFPTTESLTSVILTIEIQLPDALTNTFDSSFVTNFMHGSISSSLKNFRRKVLLNQRRQRIARRNNPSE